MVSVSLQPLDPKKVITAVPEEIAVTTPVDVTVATETSEEVHGFKTAGAILLDSVVVSPWQTLNVPVIAASSLTVTVFVSVQTFNAVNVIVVVPDAIPVTTPLALMVATVKSEETHGLSAAGIDTQDNVVV